MSSVQYTMFDFVSLCVTYIASCSFCYALLSILNSAPLYSSPCSYTFILPLSMLYLMNLWIFCKVRSTSLILPNLIFIYWTLVPLCDIFLDISILAITISTYFPTRGGILCLYNACKCIYRKLYHLMFPFHHHCFGHHSILSVSHARSDIPSLTTLMPHYPS